MVEIGIGEYHQPPLASESRLTKTADLLQSEKNPLLTRVEKLYIRTLVRGSSVASSPIPEQVKIDGLSPKAEKLLRNMVVDPKGKRRPYHSVVETVNSRNHESPFLGSNANAIDPGRMAIAGIKGDLSSVIERVGKGSGNCLEFALTMQLVAKVFYPQEVSAAEILGYANNENLIGQKVKPSRHFHLYTKRNITSENPHYLTDYGGRDKSVLPEVAEHKIAAAGEAGEFAVKNIYTGFLTLTNLNK